MITGLVVGLVLGAFCFGMGWLFMRLLEDVWPDDE